MTLASHAFLSIKQEVCDPMLSCVGSVNFDHLVKVASAKFLCGRCLNFSFCDKWVNYAKPPCLMYCETMQIFYLHQIFTQ